MKIRITPEWELVIGIALISAGVTIGGLLAYFWWPM